MIQESLFTEYKKEKELHIFVEYGNTRIIEYECEAAAIVIVKKVFSEGVEYFLRSCEENINSFRDKMQRIIKIH